MHAEEIDFLRDIVGTERSVTDLFSAGSDHDGVELIFTADGIGNQSNPIDRHGIGGLRLHNPEGARRSDPRR